MKKTYQKPEIKAIEIKCEKFIATSGNSTPQVESRALFENEEFD